MALLEKRGSRFRVIFRHAGRRYTHTLNTTDEGIAQGLVGGIEKTLMLLDQKVLKVPEGVAVLDSVVGNGQVERPTAPAAEEATGTPPTDITLRELKERYLQAHSSGAMEKNSLATVDMHMRHFVTTFGVNFPVRAFTLAKLQEHVNRRGRKKGVGNRPLSPTTCAAAGIAQRLIDSWVGHTTEEMRRRYRLVPDVQEVATRTVFGEGQ